jgi:hypothetical protein
VAPRSWTTTPSAHWPAPQLMFTADAIAVIYQVL